MKNNLSGLIVLIAAIALIAGCTGDGGTTSDSAPFIGGTAGLSINFADFRTTVFDSDKDPFDLTVMIQNNGEWQVLKNMAKISISGIKPEEFKKSSEQLTKLYDDVIMETRRDIQTNPITVDFTGLSYLDTLAGSTLNFPIVASVCYGYGTKAESKLCVRKNLMNPETGGLCEINAAKTVYTSGAPIQVQNLREIGKGSASKIGFSFDIIQASTTGKVFEPNNAANCIVKNRVHVKVDSGIAGLTCSGLTDTSSGTAVEGTVPLFEGRKPINCNQDIARADDYEQRLSITLTYNYEESQSATLTVKRPGA